MSKIKVNYVSNKTDDGAIELSQGASIPATKTLSVSGTTDISGTLTAANLSTSGNITSGGIVSGNLSGDGSNVSLPNNPPIGRIMAIKRILGYDEFRA